MILTVVYRGRKKFAYRILLYMTALDYGLVQLFVCLCSVGIDNPFDYIRCVPLPVAEDLYQHQVREG